jgi:hypothetical protein
MSDTVDSLVECWREKNINYQHYKGGLMNSDPWADIRATLELKTLRKILKVEPVDSTVSLGEMSIRVYYEDKPGEPEVYSVKDIDPL